MNNELIYYTLEKNVKTKIKKAFILLNQFYVYQ